MAGDWIKMTVGLRTHPKVVRMASALKADKLRVIGGLFAVWSVFDQHSADGVLEGYTHQAMDDELGWRGFSAAMASVGWLDTAADGLTAPRFDEHNSASAKRRALENERKRSGRTNGKRQTKAGQVSASDADNVRTREEKRREEEEPIQQHTLSSTAAGGVCLAMKREGLPDPNPGHPDLLMLIEAGATEDEFRFAARTAAERGKGFTYAIGTLKRQRADAAAAAAQMHRGAMPQPTKPLTTGEQRMLEACPSLVSESVRQRAAATARPTNTTEVVDVETSTPARRLG